MTTLPVVFFVALIKTILPVYFPACFFEHRERRAHNDPPAALAAIPRWVVNISQGSDSNPGDLAIPSIVLMITVGYLWHKE